MKEDFSSVKGVMARGAAWMVGMRWTLRALGLVNTVIIARLLTPADFGITTMAAIVVEFLMTLSETNVDLALLRSNHSERAWMDTAWTIKVLCGLAATLALLALAPAAAAYYGDPRVCDVVRVVALRAVVTGFENIGVLEFRRNLDFAREFRFWVWRRVLMLGFGLGLALYLRNYMALALAAPLSGAITVAVSFVMSPYRPRFCLRHWRALWTFSQWVILYNTARFVNSRVDQFVIGSIGTPAQTGGYYVAYDTASLPTREVIWPMGRAFTPTLARIVHDPAEMRKALRGILGFVFLIALPAGVGMSLVAEDATLTLLGRQWIGAVEFFRWLAVCGALESFALAMESYFVAVGHERTFAAFNLFQVAILAPAVLLAGNHFGPEAIAAARTVVTAGAVMGMFHLMVRLGWLDWRDLAAAAWRPAVATAAMAVAVHALHAPLSLPLLSLARDAAVGGATFASVLLALWHAAGRPDGTEKSILAVLRRHP